MRLIDFMQPGGLKGTDQDIQDFHRELIKMFPNLQVTSGLRTKIIGKAGKASRHLKGQAFDIKPDPEVGKFLSSKEGAKMLSKYKLGFLNESTKEALAATGGTGAHYHIGKDSKLVERTNQLAGHEGHSHDESGNENYGSTYDPTLTQNMMAGLDWSNPDMINQYQKAPQYYDMMMKNSQTEKEFQRDQQLKQQEELQAQKQKQIDYDNQQLQTAIATKEQERQQVLSMVPIAQSITSGNIQPKIMKDGGRTYNDSYYDTTDDEAARKVGVPLNVLRAVRLVGEKSNENQVSSAGARGVYQFIPTVRNSVLKKYGVDAWDPKQSSLAAAYLLKESADRNKGDYNIAVREYHGGTDRKNWGKVNNAYINRVQNFIGGNSSQNTFQPTDYQYDPTLINEMKKGLDWSNPKTMEAYQKSPELFKMMFQSVQTEEEAKRNQVLLDQKITQEQKQKEIEYNNQQLQQAIVNKQQERQQILSMVPVAQSITSGNIQSKIMQQGGEVYSKPEDDGVLSYKDYSPEMAQDSLGFFKKMINAPWYKKRQVDRGYNVDEENEINNHILDNMSFKYQDKSKGKVAGFINDTLGIPSAHGGMSSHYDHKRNKVVFVDSDRYNLGASSESILGHEIGHGISSINQKDADLLRSTMADDIDEHDSYPQELKSDMDSLRYILQQKGLFDPETGQYKTKDGKFNKELLKGLEEEFVPARLRKNVGEGNMKMLLDTLAKNNKNINQYNG